MECHNVKPLLIGMYNVRRTLYILRVMYNVINAACNMKRTIKRFVMYNVLSEQWVVTRIQVIHL